MTSRVLICESSPGFAAALQRTLEWTPDLTVVAVCTTAAEAIALLPRVRPDVLVMDIEQRGSTVLAAIEEIMSSRPVPILVLSAHAGADNQEAAAALAAGALDVTAKNALDLDHPRGAAGEALRHRVRLLSHAHVIRHPRARLRRTPPQERSGHPASVIGICGSTGAPYVLAGILGGLPADYPIPILVVQHIAPGFTEGLARWLDQTVPLPVGIAAEEDPARPGAWIAPEGAHLKLSPAGRLCLDRLTAAGRHRPSGDILLKSMAEAAGNTAVAVVLSGIGRDGADGATAVRRGGGLTIAQDEQSSAVYGMPQAAAAAGVDLVLSPDEIIGCLAELRQRPVAGPR